MKKFALCMMMSALLCSGMVAAQAAHIERLTDSDEYETVVNDVQDELLSRIGAVTEMEGDVTDSTSTDKLDWSACYKNYIDDAGVIENSASMSWDELKEKLDYIWIMPLDNGYAILSIGEPIQEGEDLSAFSEEEIQEIKDEAGHWTVNSISIGTEASADRYENAILDSINTDGEALYIGGTAKMRSGFVVVQQENGTADVQLMEEPHMMAQLSTDEAQTSNVQADVSVDLTEDTLQTEETYSLAEMANVLGQYEFEETDEIIYGGAGNTEANGGQTASWNQSTGLLLGLIALSSIGVFAAGAYRKKA